MIGTANQDNQSQLNNSSQYDSQHTLRQLVEGIRDARRYIDSMTKFPRELEGLPPAGAPVDEQPYDPRVNYYNEFWRVYIRNEAHIKHMQVISNESGVLRGKIADIEVLEERRNKQMKSASKKKTRRLAIDIDKKHRCPYDNCYKLYGSNVSLNLHIKLKHNGGNKTDREKLAVLSRTMQQEICMAEFNHTAPPNYSISFPPGFLEVRTKLVQAYRREFLRTIKKEVRA